MGRRKRTNFDNSAWMNNFTFYEYLNLLTEISLCMFKWKGLPETVDERFLELTLFQDGQILFFKDEVIGILALQFSNNGKLDVYRNPMQRRVYSATGYTTDRDETNSVIIWNNYLRTNSVRRCELYARRLWDLDRTIDVNCRAQKTPVIIQCEENQRLTLMNAYKEIDGNSPAVFGDKSLNIEGIKCISTGAPYVADKLYDIRTNIWNEALSYLGVNNLSINKKERVVTSEIGQAMVGTIAQRQARLKMRQMGCEQLNEMFGLNASCEYDFEAVENGEYLLRAMGEIGGVEDV